MSDLGSDVPDGDNDDELVGGLLKSLVNTRGLQKTWQSVTKRLQVLEQGFERFQHTINKLPQHYVKQEEFHDLVETQHAELLKDHDRMLKQNEEFMQKFNSTNIAQHNPQSRKSVASTEIQEHLARQVQTKLDNVAKLAQDLRSDVIYQMESSLSKLSNTLDAFALGASCMMKKQIDDGLAAAAQSIRDSEHNMGIIMDQKIDKMIQNLSKSIVEPIAKDVTRAGADIGTLTQNLAKQEDLFALFQESQTQATSETVALLEETTKELKEQLNLCSTKVDAERTTQELNRGFVAFSRENDDLRSTIQDHERRLQHHTDEIKNRSTQQDMLTCRNQVDKCASKDEFHRELGELKQIINWQLGKIEQLGVNGGSVAPRKHLRQGRGKMHSRRSSANGEGLSEASNGGTSAVSRQHFVPRPNFPTEPEPIQPMLCNVEEADDVVAVSKPQRAPAQAFAGDSDSDHSSSELNGTLVLRQQLEAVAMGVLGLAHLALREVRLGTSRNARLLQEKEVLEELANVRHWITNKVVPSGWDPSKLTTLALRCTHPREDEIKGPSPQVSLQSLLEPNNGSLDASSVPRKRKLFLNRRAGTKPYGDSEGDIPSKPPSSARENCGSIRLPPVRVLL